MYHVRSVIDRLRPLKQKDPTQHGKPVSHFKIKTLKTKDTPSPTEAKRLTRWDEALPRHFRKDDPTCLGHTKLPSTLWFHKSGDHLWTLRERNCSYPRNLPCLGRSSSNSKLASEASFGDSRLCSFPCNHHATLILIHKGHMLFLRVHSDLGRSQGNQSPCSRREVLFFSSLCNVQRCWNCPKHHPLTHAGTIQVSLRSQS